MRVRIGKLVLDFCIYDYTMKLKVIFLGIAIHLDVNIMRSNDTCDVQKTSRLNNL